MFMRGTSRYEAGSRFKYTPDYIDLSYQNLVNAIGEAIDKQMEEDGEEYFTDVRVNINQASADLDFDKLYSEFNSIVANIPGSSDQSGETDDGQKFRSFWAPRISQIVEKYLGKGKTVAKATRDQAEALSLIVLDLKKLVEANK